MAEQKSLNSTGKASVARLFDRLIAGFNAAGSSWIFVMMALLTSDVVCRALFNSPIKGVPLLIELSMVVIVFMQLPSAIRSGRLTRSDILLARLVKRRPSIGITMRTIYDALGVILMIIIFIYTWPTFFKVFERGTHEGLEGDFALPTWPFKLLILVGSALCTMQFLRAFRDGVIDLLRLRAEGAFESRRIVIIGALFLGSLAILLGLAKFTEIEE